VIEALLEQAREQETGAGVPDEYLVAHANEALAADPRTAELELDVSIDGREVIVSGTVATPERQAAVAEAVAKALPGREVRNLTAVENETAEPFVETLP
jgi:osmotically-inducible protein OsmY